jgi:hypothetical protein
MRRYARKSQYIGAVMSLVEGVLAAVLQLGSMFLAKGQPSVNKTGMSRFGSSPWMTAKYQFFARGVCPRFSLTKST